MAAFSRFRHKSKNLFDTLAAIVYDEVVDGSQLTAASMVNVLNSPFGNFGLYKTVRA